MLIPIESNVYFIPERLKEIDNNYFIVLNTDRQAYEVHHKGQIGSTYALTVPYDELDQRTIDLVYKTRIENMHLLIEEMDNHNDQLEISRTKSFKYEADAKVREMHRYVSNHESKDTIPDDAYTTRFV